MTKQVSAKNTAMERVKLPRRRHAWACVSILIHAVLTAAGSHGKVTFSSNLQNALLVVGFATTYFPVVAGMDDECDAQTIQNWGKTCEQDTYSCCQELFNANAQCFCQLPRGHSGYDFTSIMSMCYARNYASAAEPLKNCLPKGRFVTVSATASANATATATATATGNGNAAAAAAASTTGNNAAPTATNPSSASPPKDEKNSSKLDIIIGVLSGISALIAILMWILGVFGWLWKQCKRYWNSATGQKQRQDNASKGIERTDNNAADETKNGGAAAVKEIDLGQLKFVRYASH